MNYQILKPDPKKGRDWYELRVNLEGKRGSQQMKRRFKTSKLANEFLQELMRGEVVVTKDKATLESEYHLWREACDHKFAEGWKTNLDGYWKQIKPLWGHLPVEKFGPSMLGEIERHFLTKGNSQKTVNSKVGMIQTLLRHAFATDRISKNPAGKFKKAKPKYNEVQFLEEDEAQDFLSWADAKYPFGSPKRWIFAVYATALNAGPRAGEIWALKPRCLKPEKGQIRITEQYHLASKKFTPPKGKISRSTILNEYLAYELQALCVGKGRNDLIFEADGEPIDHNSFRRYVFAPDITEWGRPDIRFHDLRHTFATLLVAKGVNLKTVQLLTGHKQIETLMRYVHALGGDVQKASEAFSVGPIKKAHLEVVR